MRNVANRTSFNSLHRGSIIMARTKPINFAALVKILRKLNYTQDESRSGETHVTFAHPDRTLGIFLPAMRPQTRVSPTHLAVIRRVIEESDSDEAEEFEGATKAKVRTNGRLRVS
jgi:hypothetical protein